MISIRVDTRAVKKLKERVVENVNRRYRNIVYKMFEDMLMVSAQYSGEYTSNWQIVADTATPSGMKAWAAKGSVATSQQPHRAGDPAAITAARDAARRVPFNYKQKVYFFNPSPLVFTADTVTGPDGVTQRLRPENIIPGNVQLKSYLYAKYKAS